METRIVKIEGNIERILEEFSSSIVAFPTETVYGLGAIAWREDLVKKVFDIKKRPEDNPLIVHVSTLEMLKKCIAGDIPEAYKRIIDLYWPGPLTLLFKRSKRVLDCVTAGGEYVAIRIPKHKETLLLLDMLKCPIVGPSANKSTKPSPTTAEHVLEDLSGEISIIVDGGPCEKGVESTVINCLVSPPLYLRAGAISFEELQKEIPDLSLPTDAIDKKVSCPGTKYKHYSPTAPVFLISGEVEDQIEKIRRIIKKEKKKKSRRVGLLLTSSRIDRIDRTEIENNCIFTLYSLGESVEETSQRLFDGLRYLDRHTEVIYTCELEESGIGRAVMDRLRRAASKTI